MKAKSKEHYIAAWRDHVSQFIHVCIDADAPIETWDELKADMMALVEVAASKSFPEPEITCGACTVAVGAHTEDENCKRAAG